MKVRLVIALFLLLFTIFAIPALAQDGDGDAVPDNIDQCPTQGSGPYGVGSGGCPVDAMGACNLTVGADCTDTDGDGFPAHFDLCPTTAGASNGCPSGGAVTFTNNIFYLDNGLTKQWNPVTGQNVDWGATYQFNEKPVLSPFGTGIAYSSWASDAGEVRRGFLNGTLAGQFFGPVISNIWYYPFNAEAVRLAAQPTGAFMSATESMGLVRSEPVWSPDGESLAWTQLTLPNYAYQLVVHNLTTGSQMAVVSELDPGFWDVSFYMHKLRWGAGGISIVTVQMGQQGPGYVLDVYDPYFSTHERYALNFEPVMEHVWITGEYQIAFLQGSQWQIFDQLTQTTVPSTAIARYSLNNPNGIRLFAYPSNDFMNWQAIAPDGHLIETFSTELTALDDVALSPDGNSYAYINNGSLYIHMNGQTNLATSATGLYASFGRLSGGLTWGAMGWLVP